MRQPCRLLDSTMSAALIDPLDRCLTMSASVMVDRASLHPHGRLRYSPLLGQLDR